MAGNEASVSDEFEQASDAAVADFGEGECDATIEECPRSKGRALLDSARKNIAAFKQAVKQKYDEILTPERRAQLAAVKDNVGGLPLFDVHNWFVQAHIVPLWNKVAADEPAPADGSAAEGASGQ
jgi:hypothetical protein